MSTVSQLGTEIFDRRRYPKNQKNDEEEPNKPHAQHIPPDIDVMSIIMNRLHHEA